jgi:hypothetical protein
MGIAQRVAKAEAKLRERQEAGSPTDLQDPSSLVLAEPEHIKRLKGVMYTLTDFIRNNQDGSPMGKMAFLMTTISDEIAEEMREYDEMTIRKFMFQVGEIISWIGHGNNELLPEAVRGFAEGIQPTVVTAEVVSE